MRTDVNSVISHTKHNEFNKSVYIIQIILGQEGSDDELTDEILLIEDEMAHIALIRHSSSPGNALDRRKYAGKGAGLPQPSQC